MSWILLICATLVCLFALGRAYDVEYASGQPAAVKLGDGTLIQALRRERIRTWRCQNALGRSRTPTAYAAERSRSVAFRKWAHRLWASRANLHCAVADQVGNVSAWLCIHRYEGAWNDPNPPYYGGLQMDLQFQRTYGADLLRVKGTADHWAPYEQMIVAERARRSGRGYYPWPNTARMCGLI